MVDGKPNHVAKILKKHEIKKKNLRMLVGYYFLENANRAFLSNTQNYFSNLFPKETGMGCEFPGIYGYLCPPRDS